MNKIRKLTEDINEIIAGCIENNRQSQEELYRILSPKMYAVCLQYASDPDEACDFLQEGFIRVFGNIGNFRGEGSFEGWVRRIMVNTALQFIRKKRQMYLINEDITEDAHYEVADTEYALDADDLLEMIGRLPVNQRLIFNLYAIEGYNHSEIEGMTGIPVNTSKSHLHRARLALKDMLSKEAEADSQKIKKNV